MRIGALEVIDDVKRLKSELSELEKNISKELGEVKEVTLSLDVDGLVSDIIGKIGDSPEIRGKDGKTPTKKELISIIKPLIPEPIPGEDGLDAIVDEEAIIEGVLEKIALNEKVDAAIEEYLKDFKMSAKNIIGIQDILPKYPPTFGGGSGATFVKSMRDVYKPALETPTDGDQLTWDSDLGKFTLGQGTTVLRITSDTTLTDAYRVIFCDTDGGPITVTLPAGADGREYRIINTGSSGNNVTLTPDGSELLLGANSSFTLTDGDVLIITYESTEGWW